MRVGTLRRLSSESLVMAYLQESGRFVELNIGDWLILFAGVALAAMVASLFGSISELSFQSATRIRKKHAESSSERVGGRLVLGLAAVESHCQFLRLAVTDRSWN